MNPANPHIGQSDLRSKAANCMSPKAIPKQTGDRGRKNPDGELHQQVETESAESSSAASARPEMGNGPAERAGDRTWEGHIRLRMRLRDGLINADVDIRIGILHRSQCADHMSVDVRNELAQDEEEDNRQDNDSDREETGVALRL